MQIDALDNCRSCGRLYLKKYTDYCIDCCKIVEEKFNNIAEYLENKQNRNVTMIELSANTSVSIKQIEDFIRDGRIYGEDYPNLGYPCAHCSKLIKRQLLCADCLDRFTMDLNTLTSVKETESEQFMRSRDNRYWRLKK